MIKLSMMSRMSVGSSCTFASTWRTRLRMQYRRYRERRVSLTFFCDRVLIINLSTALLNGNRKKKTTKKILLLINNGYNSTSTGRRRICSEMPWSDTRSTSILHWPNHVVESISAALVSPWINVHEDVQADIRGQFHIRCRANNGA